MHFEQADLEIIDIAKPDFTWLAKNFMLEILWICCYKTTDIFHCISSSRHWSFQEQNLWKDHLITTISASKWTDC